ncbi:hypothetical protein [Haliangium sp. UPWRP_2]|nr:hypothetical protein [Haliangium sp. UPWRP_2]
MTRGSPYKLRGKLTGILLLGEAGAGYCDAKLVFAVRVCEPESFF